MLAWLLSWQGSSLLALGGGLVFCFVASLIWLVSRLDGWLGHIVALVCWFVGWMKGFVDSWVGWRFDGFRGWFG